MSILTAETKIARKHLALRVVDNLRTMQGSLSADQLKRLFAVVASLDVSVFPRVIEFLVPGQDDLWQVMQVATDFSVLRSQYVSSHISLIVKDLIIRYSLSFERLYLHTTPEQLLDNDWQTVLAETIYMHEPTVLELRRIVCYVVHGIAASKGNLDTLKGRISLLARISEMGRPALSTKDFQSLKALFVDMDGLRDLFLSPMPVGILEGTIKAPLFSRS